MKFHISYSVRCSVQKGGERGGVLHLQYTSLYPFPPMYSIFIFVEPCVSVQMVHYTSIIAELDFCKSGSSYLTTWSGASPIIGGRCLAYYCRLTFETISWFIKKVGSKISNPISLMNYIFFVPILALTAEKLSHNITRLYIALVTNL